MLLHQKKLTIIWSIVMLIYKRKFWEPCLKFQIYQSEEWLRNLVLIKVFLALLFRLVFTKDYLSITIVYFVLLSLFHDLRVILHHPNYHILLSECRVLSISNYLWPARYFALDNPCIESFQYYCTQSLQQFKFELYNVMNHKVSVFIVLLILNWGSRIISF